MKEGTDYKFVEKSDSDFYSIMLLSGKWKDIIFTYGQVSINEDTDKENLTLSFDYRIEETGQYTEDEIIKSEDFKNFAGDILVSLLENSMGNIGTAPHGAESTDNNT